MGALTAAQRAQSDSLAAERDRLAQVEAGQERARSGGRGLLAFIDDALKRSLGGSA